VLLWRDGPVTVITVKDTGVGIDEDGIADLFTPFHQPESDVPSSHGGLGLGLAIARQLVELHGGTIRAESRGEGQGASFHVSLPWAGDDQAPPSSLPRRGPSGPSQRLAGLTVLLVDDDAPTRGGVARALRCYGADVIAAECVADAFAALESARPDVILSDLAMPGTDGFTFIRELRAKGGPAAAIPAAAFTALARPEDAAAALEAGFKLHIAKPIDSVDLARAIEALTGRREGARHRLRR
jgi:CheY-like chemotaxis protein